MSRITKGLLFALLLLGLAPAHADDMMLMGVGQRAAKPKAVVVAYTGPGDLGITAPTSWWGLRAYNKAYATGSNPAAVIRRASDNSTATINILASGAFDVATATAFCSGTTCYVTELFDQTGGGNPALQSTASQQPQLAFNCIGSLPCMVFSGNQQIGPSTTVDSGLPSSVTGVVESSSGSGGAFLASSSAYSGNFYWNAPGIGIGSSAQNLNASASSGTWHTAQGVFNQGSSVVNVDGTETTGTTGSGAYYQSLYLGSYGGGGYLTGQMSEVAYWTNFAFSSANRTALCHNERLYYGTGGSC